MYIVLKPLKVNHSMIHEFYANAAKMEFVDDLFVMVQGMSVCFDSAILMLTMAFLMLIMRCTRQKQGKKGKFGLEDTCTMDICQVLSHQKIWLSIICSRVISLRNETDVCHYRGY